MRERTPLSGGHAPSSRAPRVADGIRLDSSGQAPPAWQRDSGMLTAERTVAPSPGGSRRRSGVPIRLSDAPAAGCQLSAMKIGDLLTYNGRTYVVRGFDPHGVTPRSIYLEDAVTGARLVLPLEHLDRSLKHTSRRLRLVSES